jgi:hypothetical protein
MNKLKVSKQSRKEIPRERVFTQLKLLSQTSVQKIFLIPKVKNLSYKKGETNLTKLT